MEGKIGLKLEALFTADWYAIACWKIYAQILIGTGRGFGNFN